MRRRRIGSFQSTNKVTCLSDLLSLLSTSLSALSLLILLHEISTPNRNVAVHCRLIKSKRNASQCRRIRQNCLSLTSFDDKVRTKENITHVEDQVRKSRDTRFDGLDLRISILHERTLHKGKSESSIGQEDGPQKHGLLAPTPKFDIKSNVVGDDRKFRNQHHVVLFSFAKLSPNSLCGHPHG